MAGVDEVGRVEIDMLRETIANLATAVSDLGEKIENTYVRKDVLEPQLAEIRGTVDSHASWLLWAQRAVIGAVIAALLYLVLNGGGTPAEAHALAGAW